MRVLLACSIGGAGHLGPLLPFADAAVRGGHEVLVVVPAALEPAVARSGHAVRVGAEPPDAEVAGIRARLAASPAEEAGVLGERELFGRLATTALLPTMEAAVADWQPDLILREPCEYASAVVAERTGTIYANVAISAAAAEASVASLVAPVLDPLVPGLAALLLERPYLTRFPASLDPSPLPDTRRFAEPVVPAAELPDWWPGVGGPLVYVTLGSVIGHLPDAADAYRCLLAGVAGIDARILLTVGRGTDPAALGPVPDHVHIERWVPQADVLAVADAVVSHGGSGTTFAALAAGLPVVVFPVLADQWGNGRRVASAGAGRTVEPAGGRPRTGYGPDDAGAVAVALADVLADGRYRRRAQAIAAEMAALPAVDGVLEALLAPVVARDRGGDGGVWSSGRGDRR